MNRPLLVDEERLVRRLLSAVVKCAEEAIINAVWRAETVFWREGHTSYALSLEEVAGLVGVRGWPEDGSG
jgi:L-aminopeptidase/D-esterase-like protein